MAQADDLAHFPYIMDPYDMDAFADSQGDGCGCTKYTLNWLVDV